MKKILTSIFLTIILALIALVALFYVFINSDKAKSEIEKQIESQTGLQVRLHGKIGWVLTPRLGASFDKVELVNSPVSQYLAVQSDKANVLIDWQSLFTGKVIIQKLIFQHLSLAVNQSITPHHAKVQLTGDLQLDPRAQKMKMDSVDIVYGNLHGTGAISGEQIFKKPAADINLHFPEMNIPYGLAGKLLNATIKAHISLNQPIQGELTADRLQFKNQTVSQISSQFTLDPKKIQFLSLKGIIAKGSVNGQVIITDYLILPHYEVQATLANVELSELLQSGILKGPADINLNLTMVGKNKDALLNSMNGDAKLAAKDGVLNNVDLLQQISSVKNFIKTNPEAVSGVKETHFSQLTGTGVIKQGVLTNNDLMLVSPNLQVNGVGTINLLSQEMNYNATIKAAVNLLGSHLNLEAPVKMTGTLAKPNVKVDVNSLKMTGKKINMNFKFLSKIHMKSFKV